MDPRQQVTRCAACCDEDGALAALAAGGGQGKRERETGYTALHYATQYGLQILVKSLLEVRAEVNATTKDLLLQGAVVQSGGQTPLHLAAQSGELELAQLLLANRADIGVRDYDHFSAPELAKLHRKHELSALFAEELDEATLQQKSAAAKEAGKQRAAKQLEVPEHLRHAYALTGVWSVEDCEFVLGAVKEAVASRQEGWTTDRHAAYATTDVPCSEIPSVNTWVRESLTQRVFPELAKRHGWRLDNLYFRDLFFVKYSVAGQAGLALHRDGSVVSFNLLLNDASNFEGGGTYIEVDDLAHQIQQGDCLVHSGKLRHGGQPVTSGERFILVAFVDVDEG